MGFLELRPEPGVYSRVTAGMSIRNSSLFIEVRNLCRYEGQLSMYTRRGRKIQTLLEIKWEFRSLFLFDTVILGFLTILKNCQDSSKFEAVNSTWLSSCQRNVRPIFEMKWRPRAVSRVSTGDSDILSSCDMNDEHA